MMRLRRNRIAKRTMGVVMVALIVALCVPHHHHADAVCFGNADCKAEHKHSHHDECESQGMHGVCPLVAQCVDVRSPKDCFVQQGYDGNAALIAFICCLLAPEELNTQRLLCLDDAVVVSPDVVGFKALRSPPCVFS